VSVPFSWFAALRYLRTDKAQSALVLAAVAIGVSVIVFLSALINGLQASLIEKTLGSQPHVTLRRLREAPRALAEASAEVAIARTIQARSQRLRSIDQWPSVLRAARRAPGVTAASPVVSGAGFALRSEAKEPILVRGVELEASLEILDLRKHLVDGRLDIASGGVAIGATLASNLGVVPGDKIRLTNPEGAADTVTVTGIFSLGNQAIDRAWVVTSLRHAQSLFALPGGATALELKVGEVFLAEDIARELRDQTGLDAESWMTLNAELLSGLSAQASSKTLIQFFVTLAVALGIASVLIVSVVQKTREIGILRAVGTPARRILLLFLIQGGLLGAIGSILGSALGALFSKLFEGIAVGPDGAPRFQVQLDPSLFAGATLLAVGVGLLAAAIPAIRAARLDPAAAIRHV
jgi:lipoprotein-releasing system permease protein